MVMTTQEVRERSGPRSGAGRQEPGQPERRPVRWRKGRAGVPLPVAQPGPGTNGPGAAAPPSGGQGAAEEGPAHPVPHQARRLRWDDAGMATAEYAIATVAAAGFAGLLIAILRSDEVRGLLLGIVRGALST